MIFAREVTDGLTSLVKKLDEATAKNKNMRSFVVLLGQEEDLKDKLEELAKKHDIKNTILTIDNPAGPAPLKISKEADVTVILYEKKRVKANRAFRKGELQEKQIEAVLSDLPKILSSN